MNEISTKYLVRIKIKKMKIIHVLGKINKDEIKGYGHIMRSKLPRNFALSFYIVCRELRAQAWLVKQGIDNIPVV